MPSLWPKRARWDWYFFLNFTSIAAARDLHYFPTFLLPCGYGANRSLQSVNCTLLPKTKGWRWLTQKGKGLWCFAWPCLVCTHGEHHGYCQAFQSKDPTKRDQMLCYQVKTLMWYLCTWEWLKLSHRNPLTQDCFISWQIPWATKGSFACLIKVP